MRGHTRGAVSIVFGLVMALIVCAVGSAQAARTTISRTTPLGPYPSLPVSANTLDCTMAAADTTNNNQFTLDGPVMIIAQNTDSVDRTITFTSAVDAQNRSGDISAYTLSADEIAVFKVDQVNGWRQTDGFFYLQASNAAVKFCVVRL